MAQALKVNKDDVEWFEFGTGRKFHGYRKQLSPNSTGAKLACSVYKLNPAKTAFPCHYHLANGEAIYVLAGIGTMRIGQDTVAVGLGDYVDLPVGEAHAHALTNTGEVDLEYLCLSTMEEPDVVIYPDSDKIGVMAGTPPGGPKEGRTFQGIMKIERIDYYVGEDEA